MLKSPVNLDVNKDKFLQLIDEYKSFDSYKKLIIDKTTFNIIKSVKQSVFEMIMIVVGHDNRLTQNDEKIYNYYKKLIQYYKKAINIYQENKSKIVSAGVIKILDGLNTVITSLINQFNETEELFGNKNKGQNPIYIEKKDIVDESTKCIFKSIDEISIYNILNYQYDIENMFEEELSKFILDNCIEELYNIYINYVRIITKRINDIQSRDVAGFYYELLKEEKINLYSVIKIQIDALEKENQSETEQKVIQDILSNLREGYQHLNKNVSEFEQLFKNTNNNIIKVCKIHDLKRYIEKSIDINKISFVNEKEDYVIRITQFKENMFTLIKDYAQNVINESFNDISEIESIFETTIKLTNNLIDIFFEIVNYTDLNIDSFKNTEFKDIITGINETIKIKIESLKENKDYLQENLHNIMLNFKKESININDNDINVIYTSIINNINNINFLTEAVNNCFIDSIKRKKNKQIEIINKKILVFKREQLLFEISTFEEILNYSISRLRNSENLCIKDYVIEIDNCVIKINNLLQRYSIKIIRPNPHDVFNGKEHEVLMAEKSDCFKKGEIIKVMNSGYKQDDVVILRANIIAAK